MSYAPSVRAVRAYFGLRQKDLAIWLGLSRSFLARIETGYDPLPPQSRPWLMPWLTALAHAPVPESALSTAAIPALTIPSGPASLLARLHECHYQAQCLHQQITAAQVQAQLLHRQLAAEPFLVAALPAEPIESIVLRRRWLARLLEAATDGLAPSAPVTGASAQALLAARQSAWLQEAAWLEAYLANNPSI